MNARNASSNWESVGLLGSSTKGLIRLAPGVPWIAVHDVSESVEAQVVVAAGVVDQPGQLVVGEAGGEIPHAGTAAAARETGSMRRGPTQ
jgi:hypothetical protein